YVEAHLGEGAVAVYLQGCCGDVQPALVEGERFAIGNDVDVCRLGRELADVVIEVLEGKMRRLAVCELTSERTKVELELQGEAERVELEMTLCKVAEGLAFLTTNAEPVTAYGTFIKRSFGGSILPLGYTNGMIGYLPTAEQLAEGGYEPLGSLPFFRLPAPFVPEIEEQIHEAILAFVARNFQ
ncbi:MAG: hypothetical protein ACXVDB_08625, partial [Tumebacillaceae bacterium]